MDVLKGTAAVLLVTLPVFSDVSIHSLILGIVAVMGHMFPIFCKFPWRKSRCYLCRRITWLFLASLSYYSLHSFNVKVNEDRELNIDDCRFSSTYLFNRLLFRYR